MNTSIAIMAAPSFDRGNYHIANREGGTIFIPVFGTFLHSRRQALPNQIMTMQTQDQIHFSAYIVEMADHIQLEHFGPNYYARLLGINPKISDLDVVSNKSVVLDGGTPAYRTDIKCKYGGSPTNLVLVAAKKKHRYVYVVASTWGGRSLAGGAQIVESLRFK